MTKPAIARWTLFAAVAWGAASSAWAADEKLLAAARAAQPAVIESLREIVKQRLEQAFESADGALLRTRNDVGPVPLLRAHGRFAFAGRLLEAITHRHNDIVAEVVGLESGCLRSPSDAPRIAAPFAHDEQRRLVD
mgnify:CR=1 FL=1